MACLALLLYIFSPSVVLDICIGSLINVWQCVKWDHVILVSYSYISGGLLLQKSLLDAKNMARVIGATLQAW